MLVPEASCDKASIERLPRLSELIPLGESDPKTIHRQSHHCPHRGTTNTPGRLHGNTDRNQLPLQPYTSKIVDLSPQKEQEQPLVALLWQELG